MPNPISVTSLIPKVVEVAKRFVGEKEVGNNAGFADPAFQIEMQKSGFMRGMSWCAFFVETVFRVALQEENRLKLWDNLEPLFSPGAVDTLNRFQKKGYDVHQVPKVGDLVIWRHGAGPNGHIGVVVGIGIGKTFITVEGNTTVSGKGIVREGDGVCLKNRQYGIPVTNKVGSFNLLGFVSPVN
ncbi:CHAP domain-containing protein [Spirosoma litoris]